jgi:alkanesulfonate monooxygenase SsuD/methylene tetrahydromethanopterin reductase-like flavin-dependent oxidoreductase (luciferase family)
MEEARLLATSMQQAFVRLRTGQPGKLQPPVPGYFESLPPGAQAMLSDVLRATTIGTQEKVEQDLAAFIDRTGVDELILGGQIHDFEARKRSLEIAMAAAQAIN